MEQKEIILRNLIQIAKRYENEHTGLYSWEIPSVSDAEKWLEELRNPIVEEEELTLKDELQWLQFDIAKWSDKTFGTSQRNPAIIYHLKKEVDELIAALEKHNDMSCDESVLISDVTKHIHKTKMEYADCLILLLDSAAKYNLTVGCLVNAVKEKHEINKSRTWGKPDENGVIEHIKPKEENK